MDKSTEYDEFGPLDDFSLPRDLTRVLRGLEEELSRLNPKGPLPHDDESRFRAMQDGDVDALAAAIIEEQIANLSSFIQDEIADEKRRAELSKRGQIGAQESVAVRQASSKKRHADWKDVAQGKHNRNPHLTPWEIAGHIAEGYFEPGTAKSYGQRAVYNAIKDMDCFNSK